MLTIIYWSEGVKVTYLHIYTLAYLGSVSSYSPMSLVTYSIANRSLLVIALPFFPLPLHYVYILTCACAPYTVLPML